MNTINLVFPLDYIILTITLLFTLFSAWKGFIQSILGLMTWIGSIIITLYSYNVFSNYLNNQLLNINLFQNYETMTNFLSIIIAITIIFLISLFFLKRIRKILSSDIDKQILGVLIDKTFGMIYGIIFSYFVFSTVIYSFDKLNFESLNSWIMNNSNILNLMNNFNGKYVYELIPSNEIEEL